MQQLVDTADNQWSRRVATVIQARCGHIA